MSIEQHMRAIAATVATRIVVEDDQAFVERHGGPLDEVLERERSRERWAEKLLSTVRRG